MAYDLKQLRKEAAMRAIRLESERIAAEHESMLVSAYRMNNARTGASIDKANTRPKISTERAVTRQVTHDRLSIHDHAQNNPVLLRILRSMR